MRELLHAAAGRGVEVRVLLWAGAPAGIMQPDRKPRAPTARASKETALDARERPVHCHHKKLVVVDDELAFVGGGVVVDG